MELRAVLDFDALRALVAEEVERVLAQHEHHDDGSPWLTREQAAAYVHVSPRTLDRYRREGRVRAEYVVGRPLFHRDDLDAFVRGGDDRR
jgi:excisionase family DNA binding protein